MNIYAVLSSFLGAGVEFVEALTIILAVGAIRGWKSALTGAGAALVVLAVLVAAVGAPLSVVIQVYWVQLIVGLMMLLFGIRWLRKAILRYSGLKALHDEAESYDKELERQKRAGAVSSGIDRVGFTATFSSTFLEGLEAVFIVITFGLGSHNMESSVIGAVVATAVVVFLGFVLRNPLKKVPENTLKFIVGVMLTSFGAFWIGEGLGATWPSKDLSILYMAGTLCLYSWLQVSRCKRQLQRESSLDSASVRVN
ncbi:hypothetical protein LLE49_04015 [Alicyclobacillus tolerans]|uniref:COG4280 domain-containing protein n=1 Tax=Alicyclobacillus tolerans TaxID=90970 RepID=UPI001F162E92|nr:hypothetical protein [Alicyclobacillus tolerans]MCF8563903.1 hypothetical protein [Alicyclobacillus tolerans]